MSSGVPDTKKIPKNSTKSSGSISSSVYSVKMGTENSSVNNSKNAQSFSSRNRNPNNYSKRNNHHNNNGSRPYSSRNNNGNVNYDDIDDLEVSVLNSNGRKAINISHLLDFSFEDHYDRYSNNNNRSNGNRRRNTSSYNNYRNNSSQVVLTPRSYINVNYKFIVDPKGDYKAQILDPNVPLDESNILRVIVPKNDTRCPICLNDDFVAPRMTRCGHIFCYPCLIRLFGNKDEKQKHARCPLCQEDIKENHPTLPVLINEIDERYENPVVNEEVVLQLMTRDSSKILSLPYKLLLSTPNIYKGNIPWIIDDENITPSNFLNVNAYVQFSRLMKSSYSFIHKCFIQEIDDILRESESDKEQYGDEGLHYQVAVEKIRATMSTMQSYFEDVVQPTVKYDNTFDEEVNVNNLDSSTDQDLIEAIEALKIDELKEKQEAEGLRLKDEELLSIPDRDKVFFYYQTAFNSKVKYFLSMLDVQIMKELYGEYSLFPLTFNVHVENINYNNNVVTNELIQKFKYLGHLPIGTEVAFLELDWFEKEKPSTNFSGDQRKSKRSNSRYQKSLLPNEVFNKFKKKLIERSTKTRSKLLREEHDKVLSEKQLELKTLKFYSDENNLKLEDYGYSGQIINDHHPARRENFFTALSSEDSRNNENGEFPFGSPESHESVETKCKEQAYESTVWGTKIPKSQVKEDDHDTLEEDINSELIIQQAKEQGAQKGKGKKKRIVVNFF